MDLCGYLSHFWLQVYIPLQISLIQQFTCTATNVTPFGVGEREGIFFYNLLMSPFFSRQQPHGDPLRPLQSNSRTQPIAVLLVGVWAVLCRRASGRPCSRGRNRLAKCQPPLRENPLPLQKRPWVGLSLSRLTCSFYQSRRSKLTSTSALYYHYPIPSIDFPTVFF